MTNEEFVDFVVMAGSPNELTLSVNAPTKEQMRAEMYESLQTWADSYVNDPERWGKAYPELLAYAVEVVPPKYWEHKLHVDFGMTDTDFDEETEPEEE